MGWSNILQAEIETVLWKVPKSGLSHQAEWENFYAFYENGHVTVIWIIAILSIASGILGHGCNRN